MAYELLMVAKEGPRTEPIGTENTLKNRLSRLLPGMEWDVLDMEAALEIIPTQHRNGFEADFSEKQTWGEARMGEMPVEVTLEGPADAIHTIQVSLGWEPDKKTRRSLLSMAKKLNCCIQDLQTQEAWNAP